MTSLSTAVDKQRNTVTYFMSSKIQLLNLSNHAR